MIVSPVSQAARPKSSREKPRSRGHDLEEAPRAGGAAVVHLEIGERPRAVPEEDDLGVLAADVDDQPGVRPQETGAERAGRDLGHDVAVEVGVHEEPAVPGRRGPDVIPPPKARPDALEGMTVGVEDLGAGDRAIDELDDLGRPGAEVEAEKRLGTVIACSPADPVLRGTRRRAGAATRVLLGVVGHDLEAGDAVLFESRGHGDGLDVVGVAVLEDVLDNAVGPMLPGQARDRIRRSSFGEKHEHSILR